MLNNTYSYLLIPFIAMIIAQVIKFIIESIESKKFKFDRLFSGSGGMPSTHNAFAFALVTTIGIKEGITSPMFAISLVFAVIIAYDAMGVRMETGKQAEILNKIIKEQKIKGVDHITLKELVGHKPIEVLGGILLGIILSIILML